MARRRRSQRAPLAELVRSFGVGKSTISGSMAVMVDHFGFRYRSESALGVQLLCSQSLPHR